MRVGVMQEGDIMSLELLLYTRMDEATTTLTAKHINTFDVLGPVNLVGNRTDNTIHLCTVAHSLIHTHTHILYTDHV